MTLSLMFADVSISEQLPIASFQRHNLICLTNPQINIGASVPEDRIPSTLIVTSIHG